MMTGLFDPAWHEPLQAQPWDEAAARAAIRRIGDRALAAYERELGWRAHPPTRAAAQEESSPELRRRLRAERNLHRPSGIGLIDAPSGRRRLPQLV